MADILEKYFHVRLEFGRSGILLRTVVAAVLALSTLVLLSIRVNVWQAEDQIRSLRERAGILEMENARLQQQVDELGTVESVRSIAARELGLVDPNTIIFESE